MVTNHSTRPYNNKEMYLGRSLGHVGIENWNEPTFGICFEKYFTLKGATIEGKWTVKKSQR